MNLFDVYDLMEIGPVRAKGSWLWDEKGEKYLDFYGGHAVISIGHSHPLYVEKLTEQLNRIGFYSNSVQNRLQDELADRLGKISGCETYNLFLCNSGAEANENALKVASFVTGRDKIAAFRGAFHGRTSAAVAVTDNPAIQAPLNRCHRVAFLPFNDPEALENELAAGEYAAVIVEGIQGVGGIRVAEEAFLRRMRRSCDNTGTLMILDEIQSGYGRSGKFFAHQYAGIQPDIITTAKGMGNGFPIGGVLLGEAIAAKKGMLGTTFGGNHLACAAALAVLEVMEREYVLNNVSALGNYLTEKLKKIEGVREIRGRGLMIGVDTGYSQAEVRALLAKKHRVLIGYSGKNTLRLLPSLTITAGEADAFLKAFAETLHELNGSDKEGACR
ncbi:MAG: aminotransferase class III-fold pyridoxal phosphate-dependent enzyme [Culturomica sp.]|jgi:acetylornithine aminotransferase|nr:aminotransferase class III-fold pyridoxal phosphate-dependent enzyme [Culturomica sp.]